MSLIYLACPYSHADPAIREQRFEAVSRYAAKVISAGAFVFSPISHTHPIAKHGNLPLGWDYWEKYDRIMIGVCTELRVLCLDGWKESLGVQAEMRIAEETGIPVTFVHITE